MNGAARDVDPLDRIDKSVEIDASAEQVWELVSRPGWWINEGAVEPDPVLQQVGDLATIDHPQYGRFQIRTVAVQRPSYIAYRWLEQDPPDSPERSTLVEFWIQPADRGVILQVAESGFTQLGKVQQDVVQHVEENTEGWETELAAAKAYVESADS